MDISETFFDILQEMVGIMQANNDNIGKVRNLSESEKKIAADKFCLLSSQEMFNIYLSYLAMKKVLIRKSCKLH